jgi:hypothetical protein
VNTVDAGHIFAHHLLEPKDSSPVLKTVNEPVWPSVFILSCFLLLVIIKVRAFPKIMRIIQSAFSQQALQQLEREEGGTLRFYSLGLNIFFALNISFLIYKFNSVNKYVLLDNRMFVQFCFFLLTVVLVLGVKFLVNQMLIFFTGERKVIMEYVTNSGLINQALGVFLFPVIVLAEFSKLDPWVSIVVAIALLSVGTLLKWYRGATRSLIEERIGILQIFSYFCGLEILPVFVLVKYIIETF